MLAQPFESQNDYVPVQKKRTVKDNIKLLFSVRALAINIAVLTLVWSTASFSFYFISFYEAVIPVENVFLLAIMIGIGDIFSALIFIVIGTRFPIKNSMVIACVILIGGSLGIWLIILILRVDDPSQISEGVSILLTLLVFITRIGAHVLFVLAYFATSILSPPEIQATAYAFTNTICRGMTILAPFIS